MNELSSILSVTSPFLAFRSIWPIAALVIFVRHFAPVGGEDSAAGGLITLHHGAARVRIAPLIDLLEEAIEGLVALRLIILELRFNLTVECCPVGLLLVGCGVGGALGRWCCNRDGRDTSSSAAGLEYTPIQLLSDFLELNLNLFGRAVECTLGWINSVGQFDLSQDFASRGIF